MKKQDNMIDEEMKPTEKKDVLADFKKKAGEFGKAAGNFGKKTADTIQKSFKEMSVQNQKNRHNHLVSKYNPLFPEKYNSPDFKIPNVIEIVDDAVRRGIEVCEGAIGWTSEVNGVEVLHLYDEWIKESGIKFVPVAKCDTVYCVDNFDRNRFIRIDSIFAKANEEKLAELENIAYMLGAKSCSIELAEEVSEIEHIAAKIEMAHKKSSGSSQSGSSGKNENRRSSKVTSFFQGSDEPKEPVLKWFQHDDSIKGLIKMRCSNTNSIRSKVLELKGSSSATMSRKVACAVDKLLNFKGSASMEKQAVKEQKSKLIFEIEF